MRVGEVIRCPTVEYLLERELVQPAGGEVCFRARDMTTGSRVRLALWPSAPAATTTRGHTRARVLTSIEDAGIERVLSFGATLASATAAAAPYVATEWVEGESLAERLARGAVTTEESVELATSIASGLGRVHDKGVVHGSIGPSTIVLARSPTGEATRARLVGFVSASLDVGGYAAPERVGARPDALEPRMDVYALGAVLYRCLSGRPPFENRDPKATLPMESSRSASLVAIAPHVPAPLADLVDAMIAVDPARRPPTGADVAARLERLSASPGSSAPRERTGRVDPTLIARQSSAPPPRSRGAPEPRAGASVVVVGAAFGVLGAAGVVALVALRISNGPAPAASASGDGSAIDTAEPSSAPPTPTAIASSTAPILTRVPLVPSSLPAVRFACGMSFFCSADTQYCLVAGDRETTFQCVKAVRCPGRPECGCATVAGDTCERIEGGLMVRRGVRPAPDPSSDDDD